MPMPRSGVGQSRCRPFLERLEVRLTPDSSVMITNAPASFDEGGQLNLRGLLFDERGEGFYPPAYPDAAVVWTITRGGTIIVQDTFDLDDINYPNTDFSFVPPDDGVYDVSLEVINDVDGEGNAYFLDPATARITVNNVPPDVFIGGLGEERSFVEGDALSLSAFVFDPGTEDTHTFDWTVTHTTTGAVVATGSGADFDFVFPDDGLYEISLRAADDDGGVGFDKASFEVFNANPDVSILGLPDAANGEGSVPEGTPITLSGLIKDLGKDDTHTLAWRVFRDEVLVASGTGLDFVFAPDDEGFYSVFLDVTDDDGGKGNAAVDFGAFNVAPVVPDVVRSAFEGDPVTVSTTFTDPGLADTHTITWQLTRGAEVVASGTGLTVGFLPDDNSVYLATFSVLDDDNALGIGTVTVNVANVAPTVYAGSDQSVLTGSNVTLSGSFTDPSSADTHVRSWKVFKGDILVASATEADFVFVPPSAGTFTVVLTVTDDDGGVGADVAFINVSAPPTPTPTPPTPTAAVPVPIPLPVPVELAAPVVATSGIVLIPESSAPPAPVANGQLTSAGRSADETITPRPDGGNGRGASVEQVTSPLPVGPLVLSEVGSAGFDPASERTQNLLQVNSGVGGSPTGIAATGSSGEGSRTADPADHVRARVTQTIASVTGEDDSVGIVEALVGSGPRVQIATAPPTQVAPPAADTPATAITNTTIAPPPAPDGEEQDAPLELAAPAWRRLLGGVLLTVASLVGLRVEYRRRQNTSKGRPQEIVPWPT